MRLLIDDTLATAPYALPLKAGWLTTPVEGVTTTARPDLSAVTIGPDDVALVSAGEVPALRATHRVAPDAAIIFGETGTVALRAPVRPDQIERTPIRLWNTGSFGETLARATIQPFYGITPMSWTADDDPSAQVVVLEGPEAQRPPEAGFAEDLSRAWFILTAHPAVGHVLAVPMTAERGDLAPALQTLTLLREAGESRRRDLHRMITEEHSLPPDRVHSLFARMRLALEPADRVALLLLLQRGHPGGSAPYPRVIEYMESPG